MKHVDLVKLKLVCKDAGKVSDANSVQFDFFLQNFLYILGVFGV